METEQVSTPMLAKAGFDPADANSVHQAFRTAALSCLPDEEGEAMQLIKEEYGRVMLRHKSRIVSEAVRSATLDAVVSLAPDLPEHCYGFQYSNTARSPGPFLSYVTEVWQPHRDAVISAINISYAGRVAIGDFSMQGAQERVQAVVYLLDVATFAVENGIPRKDGSIVAVADQSLFVDMLLPLTGIGAATSLLDPFLENDKVFFVMTFMLMSEGLVDVDLALFYSAVSHLATPPATEHAAVGEMISSSMVCLREEQLDFMQKRVKSHLCAFLQELELNQAWDSVFSMERHAKLKKRYRAVKEELQRHKAVAGEGKTRNKQN